MSQPQFFGQSGQQQLIVGFVGAGSLAEQVQQLLYGQVLLLIAGHIHHNVTTFVVMCVAPLNIVKGTMVSILTLLLYKRVARPLFGIRS